MTRRATPLAALLLWLLVADCGPAQLAPFELSPTNQPATPSAAVPATPSTPGVLVTPGANPASTTAVGTLAPSASSSTPETAVTPMAPTPPAASRVPPTITLGAVTTVPDTPTPAPSERAAYPPSGHTLQAEQAYGAYTVQLWRPEAGLYLLGVILAPGQPPILVASVEALDPRSGGDVTGEGQPDVIFDLRDGGSHCCWGTAVYNLDATPHLALQAWSGDRTYDRGSFVDLDGDGRLEFSIAHGVAQVPCTPPHVRVVMRYDPAVRRYIPAGPAFPAIYVSDITQARQAAATALAETGSVDACRVLAVVLPLLYSGQTDEAWAEFERLYNAPDAAELRANLESGLAQDPWYVPS